VLADFAELWPERFANVTNGVTPRRFVVLSNPELAQLLDEAVGAGWVTDPARLHRLQAYVDDAAFGERWRRVKRANKERLAQQIRSHVGVIVDPDAMFDIQVKRIHEYKRQHLNVLHVVTLYQRLRRDPGHAVAPRCVIFGGKAAPGYVMAKLIIRLINGVAEVVNSDPAVAGRLKVAFLPDYNVKNAQPVYPAADLSEQISTAGKEASGTGNMKFMMNGALTIGTLDGANIEILEQVGEDNFFLFGLTAQEVEARRADYDPGGIIAADPALGGVMELLEAGHFNQFEPGIFDPLIASLRNRQDPWVTLGDFGSYVRAQERVSTAFQDPGRWVRMSILNSARSGRFSSDRTIADYNRDIWRLDPIPPRTPQA
jgi:starch phosphorylase